jgi:hypothetical protein
MSSYLFATRLTQILQVIDLISVFVHIYNFFAFFFIFLFLGYKEELKTKPAITKMLSESGSVFKPADVARDIVTFSCRGYFGISTGFDGWLLKNLHGGMTPVNCVWESLQQVLFSSLAR